MLTDVILSLVYVGSGSLNYIYASFYWSIRSLIDIHVLWRLALSMIGLLSEANSGEEVSLLVNSGLFPCIEFIMRESEEYKSKPNDTLSSARSLGPATEVIIIIL